MSNLDLKKTAEDLIDTFLKAGSIAKEISQRGVKITIKADRSPVTDGDLAVDKLLKNVDKFFKNVNKFFKNVAKFFKKSWQVFQKCWQVF